MIVRLCVETRISSFSRILANYVYREEICIYCDSYRDSQSKKRFEREREEFCLILLLSIEIRRSSWSIYYLRHHSILRISPNAGRKIDPTVALFSSTNFAHYGTLFFGIEYDDSIRPKVVANSTIEKSRLQSVTTRSERPTYTMSPNDYDSQIALDRQAFLPYENDIFWSRIKAPKYQVRLFCYSLDIDYVYLKYFIQLTYNTESRRMLERRIWILRASRAQYFPNQIH